MAIHPHLVVEAAEVEDGRPGVVVVASFEVRQVGIGDPPVHDGDLRGGDAVLGDGAEVFLVIERVEVRRIGVRGGRIIRGHDAPAEEFADTEVGRRDRGGEDAVARDGIGREAIVEHGDRGGFGGEGHAIAELHGIHGGERIQRGDDLGGDDERRAAGVADGTRGLVGRLGDGRPDGGARGGIRTGWRGGDEVAGRGSGTAGDVALQHREEERTRTAEGACAVRLRGGRGAVSAVEHLEGEDVRAGDQQARGSGEREHEEAVDLRARAVAGGLRVPGCGRDGDWREGGGELGAVQEEDVAVVELDLEPHIRDVGGVRDIEGDAHERCGIHQIHRGLEIAARADERAVAAGRVVAKARRTRLPGAVVVGDAGPVRGHVGGGSGHLRPAHGPDWHYRLPHRTGQAVGDVLHLRGVAGVGVLDGQAVGLHEREVAAGGFAELEVGVQLRRVELPVLIRGEDDEPRARCEVHRRRGHREAPLLEIARVVGEIPAIEVHRRRAGVPDLDPVLVAAVLID